MHHYMGLFIKQMKRVWNTYEKYGLRIGHRVHLFLLFSPTKELRQNNFWTEEASLPLYPGNSIF